MESSSASAAAAGGHQPPWTTLFLLAAATTAFLVVKTRKIGSGVVGADGKSSSSSPEFLRFQRTYLIVYYMMLGGDWLQGPYVYALYSSYGFAQHDIAVLFVAGFASSMVFGTFIGSLADRFGRKRVCQVYVAVYVLSCITKHVNSYNVLMIGRLLGGVATSLLYSVFDAWMINEHNARSFDPSWMSHTFALVSFGNRSVIKISTHTRARARALTHSHTHTLTHSHTHTLTHSPIHIAFT